MGYVIGLAMVGLLVYGIKTGFSDGRDECCGSGCCEHENKGKN